MKNIRCLIADIPQTVLADTVQRIAESNLGIEIVERVEGKDDLLKLSRDRKIDVLIIGMNEDKIPMEYKEILDGVPESVIIGLIKNGRRVAVFLDDIGSNELIDLMRIKTDEESKREVI